VRVLITRSLADAERTAVAVARLGHEPVLAPVITIRRKPRARPSGRFDAVVATSHHAFEDGEPDRERRLPVFAVGGRTAEAARAAGFEDVRIAAGDAESLADLLRLTLPRPARLLYLAGRDRKPALETALQAAGYDVAVVEAYLAEAVERWPASTLHALRGGTIGIALHYSRRSLEIALRLADQDGLGDALLLLHHACLSADVAEPLRRRDAASIAVAARSDEDGLLALLDIDRAPPPRPADGFP
jgi:uroporphyrinogen-III synthase